jgi:hypothetical protein
MMKESISWIVIFILVITTGITAILLELLLPNGIERVVIDGYRLLSIFLGVLAGVALGEYFKIRNNQKAGNVLRSDLIEELRINHGLLKRNIPLRKGFWILGIRSGIARYLTEDVRRDLWNIYSNITHYNDEFQRYHTAKLGQEGSSLTPELQEEMTHLCELISNLIVKFFENHSLEL